MKTWNQIVIESSVDMINKTLEMIKKQTGLTLTPDDHFSGLLTDKKTKVKYFNVIIPNRISESKEYDILNTFANKYKLIRVEPNGANRLAIFILK